jgi:hypothetical protein
LRHFRQQALKSLNLAVALGDGYAPLLCRFLRGRFDGDPSRGI